jgi:hypothetical protein
VYNSSKVGFIFSSQTASLPVGKEKETLFISSRFFDQSQKILYRTVSPLFSWDFIDSFPFLFFLPQDKKA